MYHSGSSFLYRTITSQNVDHQNFNQYAGLISAQFKKLNPEKTDEEIKEFIDILLQTAKRNHQIININSIYNEIISVKIKDICNNSINFFKYGLWFKNGKKVTSEDKGYDIKEDIDPECWEVDHIIPISCAENNEDFYKILDNIKNKQILSCIANRIKRDRIYHNQEDIVRELCTNISMIYIQKINEILRITIEGNEYKIGGNILYRMRRR
jgi:hypothetical protein